MRSALLVLFFTGILPACLLADDQRFAFAVPEAEGRISLGVYDAAGKLVRTLYSGAEEKDFQIGLNGLLASWDGKDDHGAPQPAGNYHIRGWLVADSVKAEGMAYHFNDWIVDEASPEISGIGAVVPGEGDAMVLFGFRPGRDARGIGLTDAALWRFQESEGLTLITGLPYKSGLLAGDFAKMAVGDRNEAKLLLYSLDAPDKPSVWAENGRVFFSGALWKDRLYLRSDGSSSVPELDVFDLELSSPPAKEPLPENAMRLDANSAALLAWDFKTIWLRRVETFESAPIADLPENFHVSAGPDETLWVAGRSGADIVVRQHAFGGELLREMKIQEDFAEQIQVFASKTSLSFYLLLQSHNWSRQTLRGYRPAAAPAPSAEGGPVQVDWEIFLDKTIENSRRFGLREGTLVANVGEEPQSAEKKIPLPADPLTGKKSAVKLTAQTTPRGLWLATADGLPLVNLSPATTFSRFVVTAGEGAGSLRLYAGNGVVVAEYLFTGLEGLIAIDAGEVELP